MLAFNISAAFLYAKSIILFTSSSIIAAVSSEYSLLCAKSLPKNTSSWFWPNVIVPTLSLIPYFVTMFLAILVALSISLLAPVDISSNTSFSDTLPPSSDIIFSIISVLDINDLSSVGLYIV